MRWFMAFLLFSDVILLGLEIRNNVRFKNSLARMAKAFEDKTNV